MIKLTINGNSAYFSINHIRSITPTLTMSKIFKAMITIGDTEETMFYVDQTCDQIFALLPEGF